MRGSCGGSGRRGSNCGLNSSRRRHGCAIAVAGLPPSLLRLRDVKPATAPGPSPAEAQAQRRCVEPPARQAGSAPPGWPPGRRRRTPGREGRHRPASPARPRRGLDQSSDAGSRCRGQFALGVAPTGPRRPGRTARPAPAGRRVLGGKRPVSWAAFGSGKATGRSASRRAQHGVARRAPGRAASKAAALPWPPRGPGCAPARRSARPASAAGLGGVVQRQRLHHDAFAGGPAGARAGPPA